MSNRNLQKEYDSLKRIHNKALHELSGAAQAIKSYEFLERERNEESHLLNEVLTAAEQLCQANNVGDLLELRGRLRGALALYKRKNSEAGKKQRDQ